MGQSPQSPEKFHFTPGVIKRFAQIGVLGWGVQIPALIGIILFSLAAPLELDSLWAFIPAMVLIGIIVIRTIMEDRTLHTELEGYREYAQRVRFRLLPGIW